MIPSASPRAWRGAICFALFTAAFSLPANAAEQCRVTSRLAEGDNTFVVALPSASSPDHVTFINDNPTACGRLRISVADQNLPAVSAHWVPVDGSVGFAHKRVFNVSLVGVMAKFVRLAFTVEREAMVARTSIPTAQIPNDFAAVDAISIYDFRPQRNGLFLGPSVAELAGNTFAMAGAPPASIAAGR